MVLKLLVNDLVIAQLCVVGDNKLSAIALYLII